MYSFVLQDWITLRGTNTTPLIQTEADWLDMSPYQDVVAWLDVREETSAGGPTSYNQIVLETAPAPEDYLFVAMTSTTVYMSVAAVPQIVQLLMGSATVPVAQFIRWKVIGSPTGAPAVWDVTFRILLAANAPGLQLPDAGAMDFLLRPEM